MGDVPVDKALAEFEMAVAGGAGIRSPLNYFDKILSRHVGNHAADVKFQRDSAAYLAERDAKEAAATEQAKDRDPDRFTKACGDKLASVAAGVETGIRRAGTCCRR